MILEFTVGNFRSFGEKKTLSLEATSLKDEPMSNIAKISKCNVLRSVAIYGANSSGKSNLTSAIAKMKDVVIRSNSLNPGERLNYDPFLLSEELKNKPTHFEITILKEDIIYRYGFEYNEFEITGEWLYYRKASAKREKYLFLRDHDTIDVNGETFSEGIGLEEKTNDNRLFLSVVAQLGGEISKKIMMIFVINISITSGLNSKEYEAISKALINHEDSGKHISKLIKSVDLGFKDLFAKEETSLNGKKIIKLYTNHNAYNKQGEVIGKESFLAEEHESEGTKKFIDLSGIIMAGLIAGYPVIIDEFDAKLHPILSAYIVSLFNNPKLNISNGQLIFNTHDTSLLSKETMRRDQIWFTEKNDIEQTDLYSMADIVLPDGTKPRPEGNYGKNYIAGRYGAIPFMDYNSVASWDNQE